MIKTRHYENEKRVILAKRRQMRLKVGHRSEEFAE